MSVLNSDIIYEIIEHIAPVDRRTILPNLSLVNRSFFHTTRPLLFANVRWPHPGKVDGNGLMFFPETLWGYFKVFHLDWPARWPEGNPPLWGTKDGDKYTPKHLDKLESALPAMTDVHMFQITCPFDPPLSLFQVLSRCSSIKDLRITDTPVWDVLKAPDASVIFNAERITFSPVGEGLRVGEGPFDRKFHDVSYYTVEYRKRYWNLIQKRARLNYFPNGWSFLQRCRVETLKYLQLSGDYCSLDHFRNPALSFPVLETFILTGPSPSYGPGSVMTMPAVISLMPSLRDLRILIGKSPISTATQHPLFMVPLNTDAPLRIYGQLTSLAMSNAVPDIAAVLRYANSLAQLAISAIIHHPRLPIALKRQEIDHMLDEIREGGGGNRLKRFRIMSEDKFDCALLAKLGDVCSRLEFVELERCGHNDGDEDANHWDAYTDAFAQYRHLKELRLGICLPGCTEHDVENECTPCITDWRQRCAMRFAERIPQLQRIGLEYRARTSSHRYEDRWMDFDIVREPGCDVKVVPLPTTWYPFPEVWQYVPLEE